MISIQAFMRILPKPILIALFIVGHGAVIILSATLVYYGFQYAKLNALQVIPALNFIWSDLTGSTTSIDVSMFWVYLSVPLGLAILLMHLLLNFFVQFSKLWRS
jgi:TRAP-type C4-dicarboxylate transport system permease small subunit